MAKNQEMSEDTKTIITVLLLVFAYPVGIIMMFVWMKWPGWVKSLVVVPLILGILLFFLIGGIIFSAFMNGEFNDSNYNYSVNTSEMESSSSSEFMMEE